jgi:hypothetical protein
MAPKHPKRPRDFSQAAKFVVDVATGQIAGDAPTTEDTPAVQFARKGGLVGGKARAASLSPKRRKDIARAAARKRWDKKPNK